MAARGKPVLFFPARFDLHEVQAADGYAYNIAVQRFNLDHAKELGPFISTDAQGDWWGGAGGGTVAHAAIASFLGDTAEAMLAVCPRPSGRDPPHRPGGLQQRLGPGLLYVLETLFARYRDLLDQGQEAEAAKYKLYGVRLDTSGSIRDVSVPPLGQPELDLGVTPRLVFNVRKELDAAWERWHLPQSWQERARDYCRGVKIVVSGGFNPDRIRGFERLGVPVDIYAVGSYLFNNNGRTVTDFTADVVRVKVHGKWVDMAKVGRAPGDNPDLKRVW